jgi:hypothetical protein
MRRSNDLAGASIGPTGPGWGWGQKLASPLWADTPPAKRKKFAKFGVAGVLAASAAIVGFGSTLAPSYFRSSADTLHPSSQGHRQAAVGQKKK